MNNKELKNIIKQAAITTMPDVYSKIDLQSINIPTKLETRKSTPRLFTARVFAYVASIAILVTGSLVAYDQFFKTTEIVDPITTEAEIIGFPMVSSVSLINNVSLTETNALVKSVNRFKNNDHNDNDTNFFIVSEIDNINSYVNMTEILLGDKDNLTYTITASENANYDYSMTYTTYDLLDESKTFVCDYNQSVDDVDSNKNYIDGIMTLGSNVYELNGSIETNGDNTHTEFIAKYDDNNYVEVSDKISGATHMYDYSIYQNGAEQSKFAMKLITNNGKVESRIEYEAANVEISYEIRRWVNNSHKKGIYIKYTYTDGEASEEGNIYINIVFDAESASYEYEYELDSKGKTSNWTGNRHNKNDH